MPKNQAVATLIIGFLDRGEERFKVSEYKWRNTPRWMTVSERLLDLKFEDTSCYSAIQRRLSYFGEKMEKCHVFFDNREEQDIEVATGLVQDYFPMSLVVLTTGARRATDDEIRSFQIIPNHVKRKMENAKKPDMMRFRDIDWED